MPVDSDMQAVVEQMQALPPLETMNPSDARAFLAQMMRASPPGPELHSVENLTVDTAAGAIKVRIYRASAEPQAVIVYYHGGGWVLGDLDSADVALRDFTSRTDVCIVSVDYRLAPEHRFPGAVVDAKAALDWTQRAVRELVGRAVPVFVAGDSAGGNLAAVVAILARDGRAAPIAGQVLFYPVTDCNFQTASYIENAEGKLLTRNAMHWFWDHYAPEQAQRLDFRASPVRATDLSRLPPALIQTAEFDPLRDEGEEYAKRLAAAGNLVTLQRRQGLVHGYFGMAAAVAGARAAVDDAVAWVKAAASSYVMTG